MSRRFSNLFRRKFKPPSQPTEYVVYYDPKKETDIFGNPVHNLSASTRQLLDNIKDPDRSYHNFSLPLQRSQNDPSNNILNRSFRVPNTSVYAPPSGELKRWPNRSLYSGNDTLNTGFVSSNEQPSSYLEPFADPPRRWRNVKFHPKEQRADSHERYLIDNLLNAPPPRQYHNRSIPTRANDILNKSFRIPQTSQRNGQQLNQTQWANASTINRQLGSPPQNRNNVGNSVLLNRSLPRANDILNKSIWIPQTSRQNGHQLNQTQLANRSTINRQLGSPAQSRHNVGNSVPLNRSLPVWTDQIENYDGYENEMYSDDDQDDEDDQLLDEFCNISMNDLRQPGYQDYEDDEAYEVDEAYESPSPLLYSLADDAIVHRYPRVIPYGRVVRNIPVWRFTYRM